MKRLRNWKKKFIQPDNLAVVREEGNNRIILPNKLRLTAFNIAHQSLHLGIDKSTIAVTKDFWWPTLRKDVEYWVRTCIECQAVKVTRYNRPKLGFYPNQTERFQFIHVDLIGPMEVSSNDNKYVLTLKDRGTGYLVTAPIPDKKAQTVRDAFMQHWCGHYGVPRVVVSDNGREFVNQLLTDTFIQLGIEHRLVPPYSPQSNGFIERQHRTINQALRSEKQRVIGHYDYHL